MKDAEINGKKVMLKWNDSCNFYQPPRAHHCSVNNDCIEKFDHHCPWVGTTIGQARPRTCSPTRALAAALRSPSGIPATPAGDRSLTPPFTLKIPLPQRNYRTFLLFVFNTAILCCYVFAISVVQARGLARPGPIPCPLTSPLRRQKRSREARASREGRSPSLLQVHVNYKREISDHKAGARAVPSSPALESPLSSPLRPTDRRNSPHPPSSPARRHPRGPRVGLRRHPRLPRRRRLHVLRLPRHLVRRGSRGALFSVFLA